MIDLESNFIVPPFGEAHNHSVEGSWSASIADNYLQQGIYYYKNPNDVGPVTERNRDLFNTPTTLDIVFAHGGLTVDGSHPEPLYRSLADRYRMNPDSMEGKAFFEVPTVEALEEQWTTILAGNPELIKLYMINVMKQGNGERQGLSREVLERAIALSHESGLPTTVHIESAMDLKVAFESGADESAHLPGREWRYGLSRQQYVIPGQLIQQMAETDFTIVTTTIVTETKFGDSEQKAPIQELQAQNLQNLHRAGVQLAIGTDSYGKTARDEVLHLKSMNALSDAALLETWVDTAPTSIFPDRAIGQLKPGYEASFVSLSCNPTEDITCATKIDKRIKQGIVL